MQEIKNVLISYVLLLISTKKLDLKYKMVNTAFFVSLAMITTLKIIIVNFVSKFTLPMKMMMMIRISG